MNILITRHGQTDWNLKKKVMSRCDEPLNETGLTQAEETREKLLDKDIDLVICSPLQRAKQTANIIARDRNIEIIYDDRIVERDFGEFEGQETKDFDFPGYWDYHKNNHYEKAENIQEFFKRVYSFLDEIKEKYEDRKILVVSHGGVSIPVACYFRGEIPEGTLLDVSLALGNCEVRSYEFDNVKRLK